MKIPRWAVDATDDTVAAAIIGHMLRIQDAIGRWPTIQVHTERSVASWVTIVRTRPPIRRALDILVDSKLLIPVPADVVGSGYVLNLPLINERSHAGVRASLFDAVTAAHYTSPAAERWLESVDFKAGAVGEIVTIPIADGWLEVDTKNLTVKRVREFLGSNSTQTWIEFDPENLTEVKSLGSNSTQTWVEFDPNFENLPPSGSGLVTLSKSLDQETLKSLNNNNNIYKDSKTLGEGGGGGEPTDFAVFVENWQRLFPNKPKLRVNNKSHRRKFTIRMGEEWFRDNWVEALTRASQSPTLQSESWFTPEFFLRNENNPIRCYDRFMAFKDNKLPPPKGNSVDWDEAKRKLANSRSKPAK